MTAWFPDTCNCIIDEHQKPTAFFIFRCRIHQQSTVDEVKTHNQTFTILNYNLPLQAWRAVREKTRKNLLLTAAEQAFFTRNDQMASDKQAEKDRT